MAQIETGGETFLEIALVINVSLSHRDPDSLSRTRRSAPRVPKTSPISTPKGIGFARIAPEIEEPPKPAPFPLARA